MASSSSLDLPLHQLLRHARTTSSGRLGHGALCCRPYSSPSFVRLQQPKRGGLKKSGAVPVSYHDEASSAAHGDDGVSAAVTSVLLRQADDAAVAAELRVARSTKGRAPPPPNEGGGGKVHAAPASLAKRSPAPPGGLPEEGSGGQGGSIH